MDTETALTVLPTTSLPSIIAADTNDILGKLHKELAGYVPDATTETGRKEIGSKARMVGAAKAELVKLATVLKEDAKKVTDAVNAERRIVEERCDAIRDSILAPRVAFEAREKARVDQHEANLASILAYIPVPAAAAAEHISEAISCVEEMMPPDCLIKWEEFESRALIFCRRVLGDLAIAHEAAVRREAEAAELARLRAEEAERERLRIVQEQADREARIAAEAAAAARQAAEKRAAAEATEVARKAQEAQAAVERAAQETQAAANARAAKAEADRLAAIADAERREQEAADRLQKAAQDRLDAEAKARREAAELAAKVEADRVAAEQKAERDRAAAVAAETKRSADAKAAQDIENAKRAANVAHRKRINGAALAAIIKLGASEKLGKAIITAIARGDVPAVSIGY